MVVTQWAFLGPALVHSRRLGMALCQEDLEALAHFWRVVGFLMGIEDRQGSNVWFMVIGSLIIFDLSSLAI